jgi:hypothetical protein
MRSMWRVGSRLAWPVNQRPHVAPVFIGARIMLALEAQPSVGLPEYRCLTLTVFGVERAVLQLVAVGALVEIVLIGDAQP